MCRCSIFISSIASFTSTHKDENKKTLGYVFIGEGNFKENEGSKPMSIKWELNEPMPNYLWKESAKMSVG